MQILTQGGGFFAAENGVNSNRLLYIMDYEESNGESYDKK